MSKIKLTGSNSGYVEISSAADAGNLTLALPTSGTALLSNGDNVYTGITTFTNDFKLEGGSYDVLWDASDNQLEFDDNAKLSFGGQADMRLFHNGTDSVITNATGDLYINNNADTIIKPANDCFIKPQDGENGISVIGNGAVELYFNNSKKIETTNTGAVVTGICTATSFSGALIPSTQLSHRNLIINGAMTISQRGTDALSVTNSGQNYQVDMYRARSQGGQFSIQQVTDAPSGTGLYNSLKVQVTSADTSVGNSDYHEIIQYIEGYNFLPTEYGGSGAKTCTLSFYVKSNIADTFTGAVGNVGNNRGFGFNYTINSANTWERKTITIPGDTTGSWNKGNSVGLKVIFSLGIGANFATANVSTWETRETMGTDDGYNLMASTSNNIYFTGIQFEVGEQATPFEHRSFTEELTRCYRYYRRFGANGSLPTPAAYNRFSIGYSPSSADVRFPFQLDPPMRINPVNSNFSKSGSFAIQPGSIGSYSLTCDDNSCSPNMMIALMGSTSVSSGTGSAVSLHANNDTSAYIEISAEF